MLKMIKFVLFFLFINNVLSCSVEILKLGDSAVNTLYEHKSSKSKTSLLNELDEAIRDYSKFVSYRYSVLKTVYTYTNMLLNRPEFEPFSYVKHDIDFPKFDFESERQKQIVYLECIRQFELFNTSCAQSPVFNQIRYKKKRSI